MPDFVQKFSEEEVQFGRGIGAGSFGMVQLGKLNGLQVAIKTLRASVGNKEEADLELEVMAKLSHRNVLKLIGVVRENFDTRPQLIFEYMENGSLLNFIQRNKIDEKTRISFAYDIACGMDYLQEMQHVHRDLSGRNVLIDSNKRAKVGDFGLSRFIDVDNASYYKIECEKPLPFRWVPKESIPSGDGLEPGKFSFKSDVWSYGVTIYEIWSNGRIPYGNITNSQVVKEIRDGRNPNNFDMPEYSLEVKTILDRIFRIHPVHRPGFAEIKLHLANIKNEGVKSVIINGKVKSVVVNGGVKSAPILKTIKVLRFQDTFQRLKISVKSDPVFWKSIILPKDYKPLVQELKDIESEIVLKTMIEVDRSLFGVIYAYELPLHIIMLEALAQKIKPGHKCLAIGSRYMTVCLASMVGSSGKVYGINHMECQVAQFKVNIKSDDESSLISKRIQVVEGDGRQGYIDEAPYDIILIRTKLPILYEVITDQLREGGRVVTMVGNPEEPREFKVIDKINGKLIGRC